MILPRAAILLAHSLTALAVAGLGQEVVCCAANFSLPEVRMPADHDDLVREVLSINPTQESPRNSEGDIVALRDGRLLLAYSRFTSGSHDNSAAYISARFSSDEGRTWGPDQVLLEREGEMNSMSVSLLRLASGDLAIFYLIKNSTRDCRLFMRTSGDEAKSWSDRVCATPEPGYHVVNNARVVQLSSGRLVVPASLHGWPSEGERIEPGRAMCFLSDDMGKTWRRSKTVLEPPPGSGAGLQEPGVIELKTGTLFMLCRTDLGVQYRSHSGDGGNAWSPAEPSNIASPCSPATLRRIPNSGEVLMIWNDHSAPYDNLGQKRTPLTTAISRDEGKTWTGRKVLEDDPEGWFCYTSCTFAGDSALLSYCAGGKDVGRLNRLRVMRIHRSWFLY